MVSLILAMVLSVPAVGAPPQEAPESSDKAKAYYHFSLSRFHRENENYPMAVRELETALTYDAESSELHSWLALSLAETNQFSASIEACKRSIELDSENPDPHLLLGKIYVSLLQQDQANLEKAISSFTRYIELAPHDPDALYSLAGLYFSSQQWEKASDVFGELRKIRDDIPGVALRQAQSLANIGKIEDALEALRTSLNNDAELEQKLSLMGHLYSSLDEAEKAINVYKRAQEVIRDPARRSDIGFSLGRLLTREGRFEEAIEVLSEVVKHSYDPQANVELGKALEGARRYSIAVEKFQSVLDQEPDHLEANYYMASSLRNLGRRTEAIAHLEKLIELTANDSARESYRTRFRQFLAVIYQESRQHDKAVQLFRTLSDEQPENRQAKLGLVYALKDADQLGQALELSQSLYEMEPDDINIGITHARMLSASDRLSAGTELLQGMLEKEKATGGDSEEIEEFYISVSQLYSEHGQHRKAQQVIQDALSENPDSERLTFQLGSIFERLGEIGSAEEQFRKVLDKKPDHAAVLNYLGYMLADRGTRLEEALGYIERAVAQDPHNGAYLDSLGWVYFKLDKLKLAEENLIQAIRVNDSDPTILEHLGDLYRRLGDRSKALDYYRRSVSRSEDPKELEKVRAKLAAMEKSSPPTHRFRKEER